MTTTTKMKVCHSCEMSYPEHDGEMIDLPYDGESIRQVFLCLNCLEYDRQMDQRLEMEAWEDDHEPDNGVS
jgi:hypothetical protein